MALDNWSVHVAEEVVANLSSRKSRIHLLWQPTYAPWTNPIEKLWLCFNREVGHMHRHANSWRDQRIQIEDWLARLPHRKQEILRLTGLAPEEYQ